MFNKALKGDDKMSKQIKPNKLSKKHPVYKNLKRARKQDDAYALGVRIKAARESAGFLKIIDFKNKFFPDVNRALYYQWEVGIRNPSEESLKKISQICKVNYHWLKTGEGDPLEGIKMAEEELTDKKTYIAFMLLRQKHAKDQGKEIISESLRKKLYEITFLAPTEKKEESVVFSINVALMQTILKEIAQIYIDAHQHVDYDKQAELASQIYSSIIEHESRPKEQLKQAKIVVNSYKRLILKTN